MRVQAQYLQPGDVVGTGEVVHSVIVSSIHWPTHQCCVRFVSKDDPSKIGRQAMWRKRTMINVRRNSESGAIVS